MLFRMIQYIKNVHKNPKCISYCKILERNLLYSIYKKNYRSIQMINSHRQTFLGSRLFLPASGVYELQREKEKERERVCMSMCERE